MSKEQEDCPICLGEGIIYNGYTDDVKDCLRCAGTGKVEVTEGEEDENYDEYTDYSTE